MATAGNSILALLLVLSMLLSPAAYDTPADVPELTITMTDANNNTISTGLVKTEAGLPAFILNALEQSLMIADGSWYLNDGTTTSVLAADDLLNALSGSLPEPTENDLNAILILVQGAMSGVSSDAVSLSSVGDGMTFAFDVDQLAKDLHTAVPEALNTYASFINPTLEKYSQPLMGQTITCADLAAMWPELGLNEISTGLKGEVTLLPTNTGISMIGSLSGLSFLINAGEDGLSCKFTAPDGKEYVFDTNDLLVIANVLAEIPTGISSGAFNVTETNTTLHITLDLTALAADLNRSFAYAIAVNDDEVDTLLNKYRPWFELIDEDFAASLTADHLKAAFQQGLISLPAQKGELTVTLDTSTYTTTVDGYFANCTLNGKYHERLGDGSFIFAVNNRVSPLYLTLDIDQDYSEFTYSLSSSVPVLDLFSTLTLHIADSRYPLYTLTTDTNALYFGYSSREQYIEAKLGPVNMSYKMDEEDVNHFEFYMPEFFARLTVGEEYFELDSSVFGLDFSTNRNGFVLDGYLYEDLDPDYNRYEFGLYSNENTMFSAYLSDGRYENYAVTMTGIDHLSFSCNGDIYTFSPYYGTEQEAYIIALNGEAMYSLTGEVSEDGSAVTIYLREGTDLTAAPLYTFVVDSAPDKVALPADAVTVDPETFLNKLFN